jgi:hypothetical protein
MDFATTRTGRKRWKFAPAVTGLVIAVLTGGMLAMPAHADDRGHDGRRHDDHRGHGDYRLHSYGRPAYVYAPPPVAYAPPPGPPVIDFVFPLRFR